MCKGIKNKGPLSATAHKFTPPGRCVAQRPGGVNFLFCSRPGVKTSSQKLAKIGFLLPQKEAYGAAVVGQCVAVAGRALCKQLT